MTTTHPSASESGELNLDHLEALTDEQYQEVLRPVLSRYGMQRFLNGDEITLNPSDYRAIIERARATQPVAAPTAGDSILTWEDRRDTFIEKFPNSGLGNLYFAKQEIAELRAALANQPAPLDADEMTRLRRLMKALGHHAAFEMSDAYVRGILCTVLGQAAGVVERALANQPEPTVPATPVEYMTWWTSIETDLRKSLLIGAGRDRERLHDLLRTAYEAGQAAHQPAQEQANNPTCRKCRNTGYTEPGDPETGATKYDYPCPDCGPAAQEQAEPVAWMDPSASCVMDAFLWQKDRSNPQYSVPVYTPAPQAPVAAAPDALVVGAGGQIGLKAPVTRMDTGFDGGGQNEVAQHESKLPLTATHGPLGLTDAKTRGITKQGFNIVGYVLRSESGDEICISAESAVRWLPQAHYWRLMHEQNGSLFGRQGAIAVDAAIQAAQGEKA